ncbi:MAG: alpha/beta hydrolase, partial [Mesorhizobium sp.]
RTLPINLLGGEKDPASDYGKAVNHLAGRIRRMGFSNLVSKVYPETRHESLNEVNRDIVMADFAAWTDSVLKS